jgi:hypothetical protein
MLKMLKFVFVKISDMPCVSVCVRFGVQVVTNMCIGLAHFDANVFCNKGHAEDGLIGPKHLGA